MLSRRVKNEWVTTGTELMSELKFYSDVETSTAISFFTVGLSSLYFDIGKVKRSDISEYLNLRNVNEK